MGGGVIQNPPKNFPSKNMEIDNSMTNLYKIVEKVILINRFRPPPPIKSCPILPYSRSHTMTFKEEAPGREPTKIFQSSRLSP